MGFCLEVKNSCRTLQSAISGDLRLNLHKFREINQLFQEKESCYHRLKMLFMLKLPEAHRWAHFLNLSGQRSLA